MYANWASHDPWFLVRSLFHLQHPNSPLSSTKLVHGAFFCSLARWMPAYESMGWPMGMGGSFWGWMKGRAHWLEPRDILRSIWSGQADGRLDGVCIMIGSEDMMLNASIWDQQAAELRDAASRLRTIDVDKNESSKVEDLEGADVHGDSGVQLIVVHGAGHHLQNDLQREVGAEALLRFARQS